MSKTIGLIGEDPNDTESIKNLLIQKFGDLKFVKLLNNIRGHQLDNKRTSNSLEIEARNKKPDIIIFIRDSDGIATQADKIEKCTQWFAKLSKVTKSPNILLLNIYELEALIFADIDIFNKCYNVTLKGNRDVMYIQDPKKELMTSTWKNRKKYHESHCPDLFKHIRVDNVIANCKYFNDFVIKFSEMVK